MSSVAARVTRGRSWRRPTRSPQATPSHASSMRSTSSVSESTTRAASAGVRGGCGPTDRAAARPGACRRTPPRARRCRGGRRRRRRWRRRGRPSRSSVRSKNARSGLEAPSSSLIAIASGSMPMARSSAWRRAAGCRRRPPGSPAREARDGMPTRVRVEVARLRSPTIASTARGCGLASPRPRRARRRGGTPDRARRSPRTPRGTSSAGCRATSAQADQMRVSSMSVSPTSRQTQRSVGRTLIDRPLAALSTSWASGDCGFSCHWFANVERRSPCPTRPWAAPGPTRAA